MNIVGTVTALNLQAEGHSQARIAAKFDLGDGTQRAAEVIISTADPIVISRFKLGETVALTRAA